MEYHISTDVCVIGAGHAGCEAALACSRLGLQTVIFTMNVDSIAMMPCNPHIGGSSKGHLVREIDALGGEMGKNIDKTFIQSKMLNVSKGPAVHSLRTQADKAEYSREMRKVLENQENLQIRQAEVSQILTEETETGRRVTGVRIHTGTVYDCKAAIICTGTYLNARCLVGESITETGPGGMQRSTYLKDALGDIGIPLRRFKTGTPARMDGRTVDYSKMTIQPGDKKVIPFSYSTNPEDVQIEQVPCYLTYTNQETHDIIRANLDRSPIYAGIIEGTGPRYCPSIEDKFMRFKDKTRHQIFVEPMGRHTNEMYLQGFSTSLPEEIQEKMVRSLPGLSEAKIQRAAYAIEYDLVDPLSVRASLESKIVPGLFTAGQINGSSGYEEAAAQGIVAGINAAMKCLGKEAVIIDRSQGYIGVLIDDLVTKGTNEPYRMMTSRAEYRLFLRQDNADERLTPVGHEIGLISDEVFAKFEAKTEAIASETERLKKTYVAPTEELGELLDKCGQTLPKSGESLADLIRRPGVTYDLLAPVDKARKKLPRNVTFACETNIKYEGYLSLEKEKIEKFKNLEKIRIPEDIDYSLIKGLRLEATQKLTAMKPENVGRASRISGVSPADCEVLLVYLEQLRRRHDNG